MAMMRKCTSERGQMTVELCVVLPVALAIAVIVINAMTFFSYCSEFDRVARNAVRVVAASPAANQSRDMAAAAIATEIRSSIDASNTECDVSVSVDAFGNESYKMTISYWPTLFGLGLRSSVFGVALPPLVHASQMTVDPYSPGEIL